jgi:hypothetical protein
LEWTKIKAVECNPRNAYKILVRIPERKKLREKKLAVDGRAILELILGKQNGEV